MYNLNVGGIRVQSLRLLKDTDLLTAPRITAFHINVKRARQ